MRTDANRIALRAIRSILDAAMPTDFDIAGTRVTCSVSRGATEPWPAVPLPGIDATTDGPWPRPVNVACSWQGGKCTLVLGATFNSKTRAVAVRVTTGPATGAIVFLGLASALKDAEDNEVVHASAYISLVKRRSAAAPGLQKMLSEYLSSLVAASSLTVESASRVRAFDVNVPSAEVQPSAQAGFVHLLQIALFKLDFISRGSQAKGRGRPVIDIQERTGFSLDALDFVDDDTSEDDELEEADRVVRYWAGGFQWSSESKRDEFIASNYWQLGWPRDSTEAPAKTAWQRFDEIAPGDFFAIKGYGGQHDLKIHYVGEVVSVDRTTGRLELRRRDTPLYSGKAPRGAGAANWYDTLVPITRRDVIKAIFEPGAPAASIVHDYAGIPLNLILYGPPGTGKTFRLQDEYIERFTRRAKEVRELDAASVAAAELSYFEVIVAALDSMPSKRATVDELLDHPLVRAKYQVNAPKSMRQIVWSTLGNHTVEESKTVKGKRRFGELVFDKDHDGHWFFAVALPPDLRETVDGLRSPKDTQREVRDYDFVTFHQAYSYEDFIEGIRPRVVDTDQEDAEGRVGYSLEDGVFKRAVRKALQRTGFTGTIDDFCKLTQEKRASYFEGAPHYAIFIDEINRGNVARVFGELITLLEDDKRLGAENELIVRLPYSGGLFGVPPNLHIIGTMNTADRSVEALDAALRRRFEFEELGPLPQKLNFTIDGPIDPRRLLQTINRRLEKLRDRDHCIGHAYFLPLEREPTLAGLKRVFATKIIPLLQEYFFGDWGKIGLVLGREFVRRKQDGTELADFDHDDREALMSRSVYELVPVSELTDLSFRRIYEDVSTGA